MTFFVVDAKNATANGRNKVAAKSLIAPRSERRSNTKVTIVTPGYGGDNEDDGATAATSSMLTTRTDLDWSTSSSITTNPDYSNSGSSKNPAVIDATTKIRKLGTSCSNDVSPTKARSPSVVRFSTVQIREYDLCLGDNPSVTRGAPISLDWNYGNEVTLSLDTTTAFDDFDISAFAGSSNNERRSSSSRGRSSSRMPSSLPPIRHLSFDHHDKPYRRNIQEMKIPSLERMHLLKDLGYSRDEINQAATIVEKIKKQRIQTRRNFERIDNIRSFFCNNRFVTKSKISFNKHHHHHDHESSIDTATTRSKDYHRATSCTEDNSSKNKKGSGTTKTPRLLMKHRDSKLFFTSITTIRHDDCSSADSLI